jgi:hypothetical protein
MTTPAHRTLSNLARKSRAGRQHHPDDLYGTGPGEQPQRTGRPADPRRMARGRRRPQTGRRLRRDRHHLRRAQPVVATARTRSRKRRAVITHLPGVVMNAGDAPHLRRNGRPLVPLFVVVVVHWVRRPAAEIRGRKNAAHQRAVRDWAGERPDPAIFTSEILPGLRQRSVPDLMAATGLSQYYCSLTRLGKKVPHPRHWDVLRNASARAARDTVSATDGGTPAGCVDCAATGGIS